MQASLEGFLVMNGVRARGHGAFLIFPRCGGCIYFSACCFKIGETQCQLAFVCFLLIFAGTVILICNLMVQHLQQSIALNCIYRLCNYNLKSYNLKVICIMYLFPPDCRLHPPILVFIYFIFCFTNTRIHQILCYEGTRVVLLPF